MKKEYFDYLNMRFDLTKARLLSQDAKYQIKTMTPLASWVPSFAVLSEREIDLSKVALFVTLFCEVKLNLLIDGIEEVKWALDNDAQIGFKILDSDDTIKVMGGNRVMKKLMTTQVQRLKLYEPE